MIGARGAVAVVLAVAAAGDTVVTGMRRGRSNYLGVLGSQSCRWYLTNEQWLPETGLCDPLP